MKYTGQKLFRYLNCHLHSSQSLKNNGLKYQNTMRPTRHFSNITKSSPLWKTDTLVSQEDYNKFIKIFPGLVNELLNSEKMCPILEVKTHLRELLHYIGPTGKKLKPCLLISAYKAFEKDDKRISDNINSVNVLGWLIEIAIKFGFMADDMTDGSKMRYGYPCWHTKPHVGLKGISDAYFMERAAFELLQKYFSNHQHYVLMKEIYLEIVRKAFVAQTYDCLLSNGKPKLHLYTMDNYYTFAKYKTDFFFHLPLQLALVCADVHNEEGVGKVGEFCDEMGRFHQVQNDFWDVYGDVTVTGKEGTDIQEGKCTWLSCKALQEGNVYQKNVMMDCYGKWEPEAVKAVRDVYSELELKQAFRVHEKECFDRIYNNIADIPQQFSPDLFYNIAKYVFERNHF